MLNINIFSPLPLLAMYNSTQKAYIVYCICSIFMTYRKSERRHNLNSFWGCQVILNGKEQNSKYLQVETKIWRSFCFDFFSEHAKDLGHHIRKHSDTQYVTDSLTLTQILRPWHLICYKIKHFNPVIRFLVQKICFFTQLLHVFCVNIWKGGNKIT